MSPRIEFAQAGNAARAAKDAGVEHVIWSTLEDTRTDLPLDDPRLPVLEESYTAPHFDAKAEADQVFLDLGVPTTLLRTTLFWEAFLQGSGPQRGARYPGRRGDRQHVPVLRRGRRNLHR
jgi:uncharacterized protein YbjT (DUF2867 family)